MRATLKADSVKSPHTIPMDPYGLAHLTEEPRWHAPRWPADCRRSPTPTRPPTRTGVSADEVLGAQLSRRRFLTGAAALTGATALTGMAQGRASAASAPRLQPRIAVVGAGIAGMTAAMRLTDLGFTKVGVYEANPDRIGGRVWTDHSGFWNDGQIAEWGGELIDSNHKTVLGLAQRFGIPTFDTLQNQAEDIYYFDGGYYPASAVLDDFKAVNAAITRDMQSFTWPIAYNTTNTAAGIALSNMTLFDWIETRVPGGHASRMGQLLDVAYNIEYGEETTRQSALNLLGLLGWKASPGTSACTACPTSAGSCSAATTRSSPDRSAWWAATGSAPAGPWSASPATATGR